MPATAATLIPVPPYRGTYTRRSRRTSHSSSSSSGFNEHRASGRHTWQRGWRATRRRPSTRNSSSTASTRAEPTRSYNWWRAHRDRENTSRRWSRHGSGPRPRGSGTSSTWNRFTDSESDSSSNSSEARTMQGGLMSGGRTPMREIERDRGREIGSDRGRGVAPAHRPATGLGLVRGTDTREDAIARTTILDLTAPGPTARARTTPILIALGRTAPILTGEDLPDGLDLDRGL